MRHKCLVLQVKKWLKSVHIYRSYRKNKTGTVFIGPPGIGLRIAGNRFKNTPMVEQTVWLANVKRMANEWTKCCGGVFCVSVWKTTPAFLYIHNELNSKVNETRLSVVLAVSWNVQLGPLIAMYLRKICCKAVSPHNRNKAEIKHLAEMKHIFVLSVF